MQILKHTTIDIILGRNTIKKYNLVNKFPEFFFSKENQNIGTTDHTMAMSSGPGMTPIKSTRKSVKNQSQREGTGNTDGSRIEQPPALLDACTSLEGATLRDDTHSVLRGARKKGTVHPRPFSPTQIDDTLLDQRVELITPSPSLAPGETPNLAAALLEQPEPLLGFDTHGLSFKPDDVDCDSQDMFAPFRTPSTIDLGDTFMDRMTIEGSPELQIAIRKLCLKYRQIFSDQLDAKPASIPPFGLQVDKQKWEVFKNRGPVRVQSTVKQIEIHKQVQEMLEAGIIEKSKAAYYSQIILTPKPDGTFRFCVDYRRMNDATEPASWPIPNIRQLLARLGTHEPVVFGVVDLTKGYHQAALTKKARIFTAFITFAGVYQFIRLPFGPKRAPSYFQEMMASVVLVCLCQRVCGRMIIRYTN